MRILFVCSGNICRSPMAEAYARAKAAAAGLADIVMASAGTLGIEDAPASAEAIDTLREHEIPLETHRSSALTRQELDASDLVVVMTRKHRDLILRRHPEWTGHVRLLRSWDEECPGEPDETDLEDPIGKPIEDYRATFEIIRRSIDRLVEDLRAGRVRT